MIAIALLITPLNTQERLRSPGGCFLAGQIVETNSGPKPVEELRVGDELLTYEGDKLVYSDLWFKSNDYTMNISDMVELTTERQTVILSNEHHLFVGSERRLVTAEQVREGESIWVVQQLMFGRTKLTSEVLQTKRSITRRSHCHKLITLTGTLVMNDVWVSTWGTSALAEVLCPGRWCKAVPRIYQAMSGPISWMMYRTRRPASVTESDTLFGAFAKCFVALSLATSSVIVWVDVGRLALLNDTTLKTPKCKAE